MIHLAVCCDSIFFVIICELTKGLKLKYLIFSFLMGLIRDIWIKKQIIHMEHYTVVKNPSLYGANQWAISQA